MSEDGGGFDIRSVGDIAISPVGDISELNLPNPNQLDTKFAELTADALSKNTLVAKERGGAYLVLCEIKNDSPDSSVAVKVLKPRTQLENTLSNKNISEDELSNHWQNDTTIFFPNRSRQESYSQLNHDEQQIVILSYEHKLYEQLYGDYIVPAVFVGFKAQNDIESFDRVASYEEIDELNVKDLLSKDGKEIFVKKDEIGYAMVQDYENMSGSIFNMPMSKFSDVRLANLQKFVKLVEEKYEETGYTLDSAAMHYDSGNIQFVGDKLVIIDSNKLDHYNNTDSKSVLIIKYLNKLVEDIIKFKESK